MRAQWILVAAAAVMVGACFWAGCSSKSKPTQEATPTPSPTPAAKYKTPPPRPRKATSPAATSATSKAATTSAPAAATAPASAPTGVVIIPPPVEITPQMTQMKEKYGVEVIEVKAVGNAITVQFFVSDPEKATAVLSPTAVRQLVAQRTGAEIPVPTNLRTRRLAIVPGSIGAVRSYIATFDNSQGNAKPGDKVSFAIDEFHIENLTVK